MDHDGPDARQELKRARLVLREAFEAAREVGYAANTPQMRRLAVAEAGYQEARRTVLLEQRSPPVWSPPSTIRLP